MGDYEMKNMRSSDSDIESGGEPAADEESTAELNDFFSQVEEIKEAMAQITENIATMKGLYSKLLTATSTEDAQELRQEVGEVRSSTDKIAQQMRIKMKKMRKENDDFEKSHDNDPSLVKIRSNMHGTLVRKFLDLMQEYQAMLTKYDKKFRDKAYKEVQIVAPDASPEDIDEVLESGEEAIFQKHIMEDRKHAKAKQTLDYLKEKHNDLLALEKSITELNQLFMDMAILVETQGDLIDQIEFSVMNSKAFTEKAVVTLQETAKIVTNTRKKKVCIVITVILIILLIVVVIAVVSGVIPPLVSSG
ncbi:syntaxin protein, putative [Acanthamoeba castellanii str. Neff]|jgi:t-SNARE complex subunit (syntaxin)|uniref:Syntaxin protein, putative n=1 Tax=Acanthamoeba castellanii (strain ATCC 30010 / Neff) TaxID=1257118 RepID=L8HHV3_ACACF|nr:syntaxin protein, putative [Acanthamoeba castellanii str. Neff]ELR24792.1 syntaxin protein, putative [Acanthamoeba castellanii str. Neff]